MSNLERSSHPGDPTESAAHPHLPPPTARPMIMAVGIALILAGFALSLWFSLGGAVVFAFALAGWIGELQHE